MPDNINVQPATSGTVRSVRTKQLGSVDTQIVQWDIGGEGAEVLIVAGRQPATLSLPTVLSNEDAATLASIVTNTGRIPALVSGSLPVVLPTAQITALTPPTTVSVTQATAANLNAQVVGTVAAGTADSGNGVKVSGVFNSSPPTLSTGQRSDLQTDNNGNLYVKLQASSAVVTGNSAAGTTDSGNPVKVGGVYNASAPTLSAGQRGDLQLDAAGNLKVTGGGSGGTQYAEGTTQTTPTGTASLGKNPSNVLHALALDATGSLLVNPRLLTATDIVSVTQATAANLNAQVVGTVAAGATDSGNPVKVGGVYNAAAPTLATGQRGDLQLDASGLLKVNIAAGSSSGVQYAEGATQATPTGTTALGKNPSNILHALGLDAAGNLLVNAAISNTTANPVPVNQRYLTATDIVSALVTGNSAAGATDSGNPVKVGGVYNATAPTLTTGQRGDLQLDAAGNLKVSGGGAGTQYADGATQATPTGTTALGKNPSNILHALGLDASGNLLVNVAAGGASGGTSSTFGAALPGTGTAVGASDGTNMQALQLESSSNKNLRVGLFSGANQVAVTASSLNVMAVNGHLELTGLSAGSLNADLIPSTDVSAYSEASLQIAGTYSGTLTFQGSNDNATWTALNALPVNAQLYNGTQSNTGSTGVFIIPLAVRYLRVRMTAYTSGTATGVCELFPTATMQYNQQIATSLLPGTNTIGNTGQVASIIPTATTLQNAATANGNGTNLLVSGYASAVLNITASVAMSGGTSIIFEGSLDGGTTFPTALRAMLEGTSTWETTTTTTGVFKISCGGYTHIRARIFSYSAGTITVLGYVLPQALTALSSEVTLSTALSQTLDSILTYPFGHSYTAISTASTTTIKSGAGTLHSILVTGGTTGTITVYDNTAGSGTIIASYDTTNALNNFVLDLAFTTGLTIVTSAATKITVGWR